MQRCRKTKALSHTATAVAGGCLGLIGLQTDLAAQARRLVSTPLASCRVPSGEPLGDLHQVHRVPLPHACCNDERAAKRSSEVVASPKDPPGTPPALGLLPCRSVRYAAFVSGVGPGCRPRPWDGRSAPGAI